MIIVICLCSKALVHHIEKWESYQQIYVILLQDVKGMFGCL
jgi:hypothetical protein